MIFTILREQELTNKQLYKPLFESVGTTNKQYIFNLNIGPINASALVEVPEEVLITLRERTSAKLDEILNFIPKIKESEFNFEKYVSKYTMPSEKNICGTVCCLVGWMPKYMPQVEVEYELYNKKVEITDESREKVADYFKISEELYEYIFIPYDEPYKPNNYSKIHDIVNSKVTEKSNLTELTAHILKIKKHILAGDIDFALVY